MPVQATRAAVAWLADAEADTLDLSVGHVAFMSQWQSLFIWMEKLGALDTTLAAAVGVVLALGARREFALAARYVALLTLAILLGVCSKLAYYGWGIRFGLGPFHGMSGHVLRSFATYPALGFAIATGWSQALRVGAVLLGSLAAIAVTAMIVGFRVHTPAEAIAGGTLGWLVSVWLIRHDWLAALPRALVLALAAAALLGCAWLARHPLTDFDFEKLISQTARQMRHWTGARPCKVRHGLVECDHGSGREDGH